MSSTINNQDRRGRTELHRAIIDKKADQVAKLLKDGADPNIRDLNGRNGFTPLYYAATQTHDLNSVKMLMKAKATVDDTTKAEFMRQFNSDNVRVEKSRIEMRKTLKLFD